MYTKLDSVQEFQSNTAAYLVSCSLQLMPKPGPGFPRLRLEGFPNLVTTSLCDYG